MTLWPDLPICPNQFLATFGFAIRVCITHATDKQT